MVESTRRFLAATATCVPRLMPCCLAVFLFTALSSGVTSTVNAAEPDSQMEQALLQQEKMLGDFDEIVARKRIRVLLVHSKTFYFLDRGKQRGLAYEMAKKFEQFVNKKLNTKTLKVPVVFIPVKRDELIPGLINGLGDIAVANLTVTPERLKSVDFSDPLFSDVSEVLVTGPAAPTVTAIDDLAGKEIYVRRSSSYYESLVKLNTTFEGAGKAPVKLVVADEMFEDEDLLEMVNAGLIPMIVMDSHKVQLWEQVFSNIRVHPDIAVRTGGQIAWAFRKNSPQLAAAINEFVTGHKKGTLFGNIVFDRYLRNARYIRNSVSEAELEKFDDMVKIFQKYADRYDFDYLMIGAQAYQESGLDQKKKSPAGAIGVMQMLPTTAKDPNVGIADIEKLENNIHAGVKYMRFIVDRYFKNEPMTDLNKTLFAFAAYNAGPARVIQLRKKAVDMGLDPNVWFQNVEIAAARDIGRETVQYVGNIYKYYIAYSKVIEQLEQKEKLLQDKAGQRSQ
jgi:membrane-bound lytic murein transglycosylase MltF